MGERCDAQRSQRTGQVQATQQSAGSTPVSLHCSGRGPLSPDHTGPCLAPLDGTVTSGPLAPELPDPSGSRGPHSGSVGTGSLAQMVFILA